MLGGLGKVSEPERPFVNENNIIMYLDMVNERCIELKGIGQFVDIQSKAKNVQKDPYAVDTKAIAGLGNLLAIGDKKKTLKKMPSCAALLGKAEEEETSDLSEQAATTKPFEMAALKARAFKMTQREREEELHANDTAFLETTKSHKRRNSKKNH